MVIAQISTEGGSGCPRPELSVLAGVIAVSRPSWYNNKFRYSTFMFDLQLSVLFKNIFEVCDAICSTYRYVASVKGADKLAKREALDLCNL
jgi:hypothetical protein